MLDNNIIINESIIKALYIIYDNMNSDNKKKLLYNYLDEIIKYLNIITDENSNTYIKIIFNYIKLIFYFSNDSEVYINKIYNILSNNNNSNNKIYLMIFNLYNNNSIFKDILDNDIIDYKKNLNSINIIDKHYNYNDLCEQNNNIDKILNKCKFYINLFNNDILNSTKIYSLIEYIFKLIYENILIENRKDKIYLLYSINYHLIHCYYFYIKNNNITNNNITNNNITNNNITDNNNIDNIIINIKKLVESKDIYLSINNKSIFKFLDLIDELNI